ncbi:MAG TPA: LysR family transcriptional regulator [Burkholderiales bacterium]|jgi:DNA-binding transcriptional LysR family regulator|nr:LysR family transcriptional regulator [Burkholderiales bacterium]
MATTIQRVGRRLRFRDLEVFSAVVECGSMAKAAVQLGVTQPAVSEIVASLESAFRVRLLDRSPQGVASTIYGQALLKRGLAALDELKQGLRDISFLTDPSGGEVRVGWPESFTEVLSGMVRAFCLEHPGIALRIDHLPAPASELPELHARKLDIALARSLPEQFGSDLNVEVLFDDPAVIAAGANSRWARKRRIELADLVDAAWVATPRETLTTRLLEQAFRDKGLPAPKLRVMTFSVQLRARLLVEGEFLACLPRSLLLVKVDGVGLRALPIGLPPHTFPVAIVTVKNRTLTPVVELFLERLRAFVKSGAARF